ncbi:multisubstrate pseudouridine synthase 7-like isoform X1 [Pistacia vera]|uniref:multisubstrate pseudouridine synthase 7 isoform X1 n=1 Tax=Pistacia vera TaxID=55513 RepID=UPI00126343A9|nr:multisubstrate pseudouridine synthase 7 isoform X1 [Pistacia vera]XP_031248961.1 multisubstrate pseudouridine synthase 7 isoform X1 [Pistacia vera]XP_031275420.1 multisubstrate pseudouridine synthase 7-like isoform X1 [Pistacia vera]XP_031275422.1 multisubstrate pseudouridine synthase 7-like isoform X1 [Pistacia vera]
MKTLDESDVGIFCFISNLPGFRGILKQRYSDFIVNEVGTDGNVVHLTCLDAPPEAVVEHKEMKRSDQLNKSYASEIESFRSLAGDSDADCLKALINQITSGNSEDSISPVVLSANSDKSHRTAIHNFFKENFKFLVTDTIDGPDASSKCIRVRLNSGGNNGSGRNSKKRKERGDNPFDSRGSENWPEHQGKFLRFHLYKENKDTQEALGLIGKMLGIQSRSFGFAGTKDKRAVSTQRVTVFKQRASRLAALNKRLIGIQVGDFCYVKEGLLLGQLQGNRFTVTLRGVVANSEDVIKASANSLGRLGFINYFGLQRFGSGSVPTQLVGATLLRGEWKAAVSMILDPREGERNEISKAREYYKETDDIDGTLRKLPRHLVAERAILQCLKKCPGNFLQALKAIPRTLRMMYVHSYQSYLWNHAASMRVEKYGTEQVVVGDLVYSKADNTEELTCVNSECEAENCNDIDDCGQLDEVSATELPVGRNNLVKTATAEDIHTGKYTIDDVILPMPGSRVIYPTNEVAEVYHRLAKKDGINLTEIVHNVKEFSITSMTGSYRQVFQKLLDFEWELLKYTDASKPLAETDLDKIAKAKPLSIIKEEELVGGDEKKDPSDCIEQFESLENVIKLSTDDNEADCGRELRVPQFKSLHGSDSQEVQMALKLGFTLPTSCYATMAIRELLKTSTSVAFHKTLNQ